MISPVHKPRQLTQVFAVALVSLLFAQERASAQVIFENNFDHHSAGLYTEDNLDDDFNSPAWEDGVREGRISIVEGAEAYGGSGSALAVSYPAGFHGTKETGGQWQLRLEDEHEEAYLSYRLKFKNGFDFVRGGKLPGLAGGEAPSGSAPADGFNGWTGKMMWRTDFTGTSGSPVQPVADAISYAKYTDSGFAGDGTQEDKLYWYGADDNLTKIVSDQWYQITQRIKLNDPNISNGIIQIWLDGELVHEQTDVLFRKTADLKIDMMYFSTFFGGGSSWKTSKDEIVYFDDFRISVPRAKYLKVPSAYPTIQSALDDAVHGDVVAIRGTHVGNFVVDKQILFRGYNGTNIVSADNSKPVISVDFEGVEIKRFATRNGTAGVDIKANLENVAVKYVTSRYSHHGIVAGDNCHWCYLYKNDAFSTVGHGIVVSNSKNLRSYANDSMTTGGHGIFLTNTDNARIKDCRAYFNNLDGYRVSGSDIYFFDNNALFNDGGGFNFVVNDSEVIDCYARANDLNGFEFNASSNNSVVDNLSSNNLCSGYYWASGSNNNVIVSNASLSNLTIGFEVDGSSGNVLTSGFSKQDKIHGFFLSASSNDNTVSQNIAKENVTGPAFADDGNNDVSDNSSDDGSGE